MDHRLNLRIPMTLPVAIDSPQGAINGATLDISFEGVKVRLNAAFPQAHGTVYLCFEPDTLSITVPAIAVRRDGRDMGLMFGRYDGPADVYLTNRLSDALDSRQLAWR